MNGRSPRRGRVSLSGWLSDSELRLGLGCMRLSTDDGADDGRAVATIAAAAASGITVFDTARAYGPNERVLAGALHGCGAAATARIVTKGGMARPGGGWVPDGRAKAIRADCEASLEALEGIPIDLYLLHAPDPRIPWRTSIRALDRLVEEGLVRRVGISNVNRSQLDEALTLAPIAAVQVAVSVFDDRALRGGIVDRCAEAGVSVIAHSPLGGPRRARSLGRRPGLVDIAEDHGATPAEVALAWVLGLGPHLVALPGARRPETARSAARAAAVVLGADERERLAPSRRRRLPPARAGAEVVLVMGIPGAGKSRVALEYATRGHLRLNRDERGGTLRVLADELDEALAAGERRVVLDNTYATRASRSEVIEAAARHGARVRCIWLDTPLAQAQVNMVARLLDRLGSLPTPEELKAAAREEPGLMPPTSQMRVLRELEPPADDEGFASIERVPFSREPHTGRAGVFVAASTLRTEGWRDAIRSADPRAKHLVFDWLPDGSPADLRDAVELLSSEIRGVVERAVCPHGGGPPVCWCRPPLPGLPLAFSRAVGVDPARSTLVGTSTAHRTLATTLGARFLGA
ncbi:aldo/keto reductase [Gaiella sp.]|uniref:aldo/keto reductase n=1 Tax=Gaiella sp. TaxID=2663207 RepID=UPI002C21F2CB|nr:aldo/keto reductase [Gaiella sp.]HWO80923.1 aldo/keto reductase [Gaiella sp.]